MRKIILLALFVGMNAFVCADNQNLNPVNSTTKLNNPTVGSRQSGSEQVFGNPKVVGQKGQKYDHGSQELNKATVGSRQSGSEQAFGTPKLVDSKGIKAPSTGNAREMNNPSVGSRQSGSNQIFGDPGNSKSNY